MIAVDSSSLIAYLKGDAGLDVDQVAAAIEEGRLAMPPVVLTELLSHPNASPATRQLLTGLKTLALEPGYWERAGDSRRILRTMGLRARAADALIAQSCIDANVSLITRDSDFRHYVAHCGLKLA